MELEEENDVVSGSAVTFCHHSEAKMDNKIMLLQIRKILGKKIRNVICDDSFAPNRPSSHILNPTRLLEISDLPSDFLSADACLVRSYSSMSVKKG